MRTARYIAFDDYVPDQGQYFTSSDFEQGMGAFDQLSAIVKITNWDVGGGKLTMVLQHSSDAVHWLDVATLVVVDIFFSDVNLGAGAYPVVRGLSAQLLAYARLKISFSGATTKGQVRIAVTGRDAGAMEDVTPLIVEIGEAIAPVKP